MERDYLEGYSERRLGLVLHVNIKEVEQFRYSIWSIGVMLSRDFTTPRGWRRLVFWLVWTYQWMLSICIYVSSNNRPHYSTGERGNSCCYCCPQHVCAGVCVCVSAYMCVCMCTCVCTCVYSMCAMKTYRNSNPQLKCSPMMPGLGSKLGLRLPCHSWLGHHSMALGSLFLFKAWRKISQAWVLFLTGKTKHY